MVDNIFDIYNKIPVKERKDYEIEIRYLERYSPQSTVIRLLKAVRDKFEVVETNFIDSLDYINGEKIGTRTYIENNKTTKSVQYKKVQLSQILKQNTIGQYRITLAKETEIEKSDVSNNSSVILLKRRFSYTIPKFKNWRVDISIIRKTEPSPESIKASFKSFFNEISTFDQLIEGIINRPHVYTYQVEIEYIDTKNLNEEDIEDIAISPFLTIDKNIEKIIAREQELIYILNVIDESRVTPYSKKSSTNLYFKYILPNAKVLTKQQYQIIYPPIDYLLKEKTDGMRTMISIHNKKVYILDENNIDIRTNIHYDKVILAEGESIKTDEKSGDTQSKIIIFDVLIYDSESIIQMGLEVRITYLKQTCELLNKLSLNCKFIPAEYYTLTNPQKYRLQMEEKNNIKDVPIDGLIFSHIKQSYRNTITYKWKPVNMQTIDFLCKKCPKHLIKGGSYETKRDHDIYLLYTTASRNLIQNLRLKTNYGYNQLFELRDDFKNIPIPFSTPFVPMSYIYYHPKEGSDNYVDIDNKIVEMICKDECVEYDKVSKKYYVTWSIVKVREDRKVIEGLTYGNNYATALSTFLNHVNNFGIESLYNGTQDQYFLNKGGEENIYSSMRALSNYIKSQLISQYAHKIQSVLDLGSGRGGDLYKYIQRNLVKNLLVTDIDKTALTELLSRWLDISRKSNTVLYTSLRGLVMDVNNNWSDNVSRIHNIVATTYFNTIFTHSSLHYFTESVQTIQNFVLLCKALTTTGSHIVITCPAGEPIFELLKDKTSWVAMENENIKYRIDKLYTDNILTEAGQKISVMLPFSSGKMYEEYLVNTKTIIDMFREEGFSLVQKKEYTGYLEVFSLYKHSKFERLTEADKIWSSLFVSIIFKRN